MDEFQELVRECLNHLYDDFIRIKEQEEGLSVVDTTVDFSTRADKALSRSLREYFGSRSERWSMLSEESVPDATDSAERIVIADEIDGTANMMNGGDVPFGPIVAIAPSTEPKFDDIVAMGFLSLSSGDLYEAYKEEGAFLTKGWTEPGRGEAEGPYQLSTSSRTTLSEGSRPRILVDQYMLSGKPELADLCWNVGYPGDFRSWAYHMALVARGSYDLAVTGDYCELHTDKRSTAEELAGGYLLVKEAGGAITTWDGADLGPEPIGMADGRTFDTIVASTRQLALEFSKQLPGKG